MSRWQSWRRFLLIWLGSSLLVAGYLFLVTALDEAPSWLNVLVLFSGTALASRWLDPVAERLQHHRWMRWLVIFALSIVTILLSVLLSALLLALEAYFLVPDKVQIGLIAGLWLTCIALWWRLTWRMMLEIPLVVRLAQAVPGSLLKRFLVVYIVTTVLLAGYIALHIPFTYLRGDPVGAVTKISHRADIYVAWLIAVLGALVIGRVRFSRWSRIALLALSSLLVLTFIISSAELDFRWTTQNWGWTTWVAEKAWIEPFAGKYIVLSNLGEVFVRDNFTPIGVILSIISIANTFRELVRYWAIVPTVDTRYSAVSWFQLASLVLVFSASLTLLSTAVAVVVTVLQDLDKSTYYLAGKLGTPARYPPWILQQAWRRLHRTRAWCWLRRGVVGGLGLLLALVVFGVLLTARPTVVEWDSVVTAGFLAGPLRPVQALAVGPDGRSIFAGTYGGGVFRSDDGGHSWRPANRGLKGHHIQSLMVGPHGQNLFAGTVQGLFRSDDGGQSWRSVNGLPQNQVSVQALAVGPDMESIFAGTNGGVFRSSDGGFSWDLINAEMPNLEPLTVGPGGESLFAGTSSGVFRSDDGGVSWELVDAGMSDLHVTALVVGPDGESLFAGTGDGMFRSDNRGQLWRPVNEGLTDPHGRTPSVQALVVAAEGESLFTAIDDGRVFRSDDGGESWRLVYDGLKNQYIHTLVVGPNGEGLFAATDDGVFRSDDGGRSWQPVNEGLIPISVQALAVGPDGESIFAGTSVGGVFRSRDRGQSWRPANEGLTNLHVRALVVEPDGESLLAGTSGGVFRFDNGDRSWRPVNEGLSNLLMQALLVGPDGASVFAAASVPAEQRELREGEEFFIHVVQPGDTLYRISRCFGLSGQSIAAYNGIANPRHIYVGQMLAIPVESADGGIFRSEDGGESWQPVHGGLTELPIQALAVGPGGQSIFAGTLDGVFRLDKGGERWMPVKEGLTALDVNALAVGPGGDSLFAGTAEGIFRLDERGQSWTPVKEGLTALDVNALVVGPDGEGLFAGAQDGGVFRSDDGGQTWRPTNEGLTSPYVQAMAVGYDSKSLFVGTDGGGVFRSDDGGQSWQAVNAGLIDLDIEGMAAGSDGRSLFASTFVGVFRSEDRGQSWQPFRTLKSEELPEFSSDAELGFGEIEIAANEGRIRLTRPGMGWLPWASYVHSAPQSFAMQEGLVTLYSSAGASMILRAEVPLPLVWRAPTPYLAMVAATWQGINWVGDNAVPISASLGLAVAVALLYVYTGIARPNRLRPITVLWLLPRPRYLLAASSYRAYTDRWVAGDALERLILLQAPTDDVFTITRLKDELCQLGTACNAEGLQAVLANLVQRGLLVQENEVWRLSEPLLAQIQRQEMPRNETAHLATQTRQEHPLCASARRFMRHGGFRVASVEGTLLYRCEPTLPALQRLLPEVLYTRILPGEAPDGRQILAIRDEVQRVDPKTSVIFVVTDQRPTDQGWAQIGTLRMEGLIILPIEHTLLSTGLTTGRETTLLRVEIEKRLGIDYDPYDVRDPVAGAFSFFGRDALLEDLLHRIIEGRPAGVFGLRKMGKSSMLQALHDRAPCPVAAVNIQTVGHAALDELYTRILRYWAQWARVRFGLEVDLPTIASNDATGSFVTATLTLLEQLEQQQGEARLGLFLDEAELIVPRPDGSGPDLQRYLTFLRAVRGLVDEDGRLSLVVASLNPSINRINAWNGEQNPTFNLFQEIYLPPLAREDCIQMVRNIGQQVGLVYSDESLAAIAALSGGHPFLARQLCSMLYKQRGRQPGRIEATDIPTGVECFIYDEQTVAHLDAGIWQDAGNPALWGEAGVRVNQALLLELAQADGPVLQDDLLNGPDADLRHTALINLERFHFIHQPEPEFYALRYGLLRTWLRRRKLGLE